MKREQARKKALKTLSIGTRSSKIQEKKNEAAGIINKLRVCSLCAMIVPAHFSVAEHVH